MTAQQFLDAMRDALAQLLGMAADDLAGFFNDDQIQVLAAEFLRTGDDVQLEVIAFRLRTWARRQNLQLIILASAWLQNAIVLAGNVVGGLVARVPAPPAST